jgi:hypothetical protein
MNTSNTLGFYEKHIHKNSGIMTEDSNATTTLLLKSNDVPLDQAQVAGETEPTSLARDTYGHNI